MTIFMNEIGFESSEARFFKKMLILSPAKRLFSLKMCLFNEFYDFDYVFTFFYDFDDFYEQKLI